MTEGQKADLRQAAYIVAFRRLKSYGFELDRDYSADRLVEAITRNYPTDEQMETAEPSIREQMAKTAGGYACSAIMREIEKSRHAYARKYLSTACSPVRKIY